MAQKYTTLSGSFTTGLTRRVFFFVALSLVGVPVFAQPGQARKGLDFDGTLNILIDEDRMLPALFTVEEGRYRLRIHNVFASIRLDLLLDDDKGNRLKDSEVKDKATRGEVVVELKPGKHVLYVAQRPKWRCEVIVTDKKGK